MTRVITSGWHMTIFHIALWHFIVWTFILIRWLVTFSPMDGTQYTIFNTLFKSNWWTPTTSTHQFSCDEPIVHGSSISYFDWMIPLTPISRLTSIVAFPCDCLSTIDIHIIQRLRSSPPTCLTNVSLIQSPLMLNGDCKSRVQLDDNHWSRSWRMT